MRLKAVVAYDGTAFHGWQIQQNSGPTIQSEIQRVLQHICHQEVRVTGAGRTDSGVHAIGQVAHFDWEHALPPDRLILGLNGMLPDSIRVLSLEPVDSEFHARYDARSKIYLYRIDRSRFANPSQNRFSLHFSYPLDCDLLRECASRIEGEHDFAAFQATGTDIVGTVRTVLGVDVRTDVEHQGSQFVTIRIHSNGFLRKMARFLIGTMLEIAGGRRPLADLSLALDTGDRGRVGVPAAARGLFLEKVRY
jgi:tRNA pseudouridine38-40 synthase